VETLWVKTLVNIFFTARGFLTWHVWMNVVFMASGYALVMVRAAPRRPATSHFSIANMV
jgi:hypothetical protein